VELTNDPHWHWCGTHRLRPSRKPTPTLTTSSSSRRPHEVIGMAKSQSPLWGEEAAKKDALRRGIIIIINPVFIVRQCLIQARSKNLGLYYLYCLMPIC